MKFDHIFVPNPAPRFDVEPLRKMTRELVYVCDTPMFDDIIGPEFKSKFEERILETMKNFDAQKDAIAFFGDPIIFAMMIIFVQNGMFCDDSLNILRFSAKRNEYMLRTINMEEG